MFVNRTFCTKKGGFSAPLVRAGSVTYEMPETLCTTPRTCWKCGQTFPTMKICKRCRMARFCSEECAEIHLFVEKSCKKYTKSSHTHRKDVEIVKNLVKLLSETQKSITDSSSEELLYFLRCLNVIERKCMRFPFSVMIQFSKKEGSYDNESIGCEFRRAIDHLATDGATSASEMFLSRWIDRPSVTNFENSPFVLFIVKIRKAFQFHLYRPDFQIRYDLEKFYRLNFGKLVGQTPHEMYINWKYLFTRVLEKLHPPARPDSGLLAILERARNTNPFYDNMLEL